jgi:hypothetical protein
MFTMESELEVLFDGINAGRNTLSAQYKSNMSDDSEK